MTVITVTRRAVLWVPDWPVVAAMAEAGLSAESPAAVLNGRGLIAVSATARAAGVRRGTTRRLAQRVCPELVLLPHDQGRDARQFEAVAAAAEHAVSGVEISRPGLLMIPADGAARFHGSEESLAEALVTSVADVAGVECAVGVADGLLAAVVAARESSLVPAGQSPAFLAPAPVEWITLAAMDSTQRMEAARLASVLVRLGIVTLGDLASLPFAHVVARFGPGGAWAHRLAAGQDLAPPVLRRSEEDIAVEHVFEDPVERIDHLTGVATQLAQALDQALLDAGVRCGRVEITARTHKGDDLSRVWRTDVGARAGAFAAHMTDRVRWQLEGWLSGTAGAASGAGAPEPAPLIALGLVAQDVVALGAEQSYLWGGSSGADARAHRALERVQGLLGLEGVLAVAEQGGRSPRDRAHLVPWGQEAPPARAIAHPWPGKIPDPAPATVPPAPRPAQVLDAGGAPVVITRRLGVSAPPTWVRLEADPADERARAVNRHPSSGQVGGTGGIVWERPRPVESWAGPWPIAERWWAEDSSRRAYLQLVMREGASHQAVLLAYTQGRWELEAIYD